MLIVRCDFSLFLLGVAEPVQKAETEWKTDQNQTRSEKVMQILSLSLNISLNLMQLR